MLWTNYSATMRPQDTYESKDRLQSAICISLGLQIHYEIKTLN